MKFDFNKDFSKALKYYEKNGIVIFKDFFSKKLIDNLNMDIAKIATNQCQKHKIEIKKNQNVLHNGLIELAKKNDILRSRIYEIIQELPSLLNLAGSKKIYYIAKKLKIQMPILRSLQIRMDLPYQDKFLIPPHQEIKGIRSPNMIFFITALDNIDSKMGAVNVSKKSFQLGPISPSVNKKNKYQFVPNEIFKKKYPLKPLPLKKGETALINMYTIHASGNNISNKIRWTNIIRIEDAGKMPFLDNNNELDIYNLKG